MPGWRENSVGLRCYGIRPAVSSQWEIYTSYGFLKRDVGENRVSAYAHDLGVQLGKPRKILLECREFIPSNRREVQSIKEDNNPLAPVIGKFKFSLLITYGRFQIEIRRCVSNVQWHLRLLSEIGQHAEQILSAA